MTGKLIPDPVVYKAGIQSSADPFEFVMSSPVRDRMGDIVEQDWDLRAFRKNPIALWAHNSAEPIGTWERVRVEGDKLLGRLKLAARGTSELIDTLHSLVEQRVVKAVSVGFLPGKYEALDEDDPWAGYRLSNNELMECSLCSVPANPEALSVAKTLGADLSSRIFDSGSRKESEPALIQLLRFRESPGRESQEPTPSEPPTREPKHMSLAEKIKAKQARINELKNQLAALDDSYNAEEDMPEEVMAQYTELAANIDKAEKELGTLERAEKALAVRASQQVAQPSSPQSASPAPSAPQEQAQRIALEMRQNRPKGHRALAAISCLVKAHTEMTSGVIVAEREFRDEPDIGLIVRAATDPASMTDAAWAAPLVQETWAAFIELIRDLSIYPAVPGTRVEFDRYGKINVPRNAGRGQLAGSWVGELSPIPVKEGAYDLVDLQPKKLGVITSFSKEIGMHSIPAIQGLLQTQLLADTAESIDAYYLDNGARSATRPAGLQDATETGAANIVASGGNTVALILADAKGMISRLVASRNSNGAVWIMNPLNILALSILQDAASGEFVFREELSGGTFMGYPFLVSQNVPVDVVVLHGNQAMMHANDYAPMISVSSETALVFDDTAPDNLLPDTNTQPAKSMFQVDGVALKLTLGMDWRIVRANAIQVLTGVGWSS